MAQTVADVMTANPATVEANDTVSTAARLMREKDAGGIVVTDGGHVRGIITDRDIAIRVMADGKGPDTPVREASSEELTTVSPDATVDEVVRLMRERAIRRVPVVRDDQAVGIVSLGDLAMERDSRSALGGISAAPPNQ
ncbi:MULTISPECIES: CBS domain-containing protein [Sphaerimonospora]|uniref:CBS domain-containing protein YhcV n=2 Tax=Sphaerimonospora TaxID=1792303 RepID=A0A8J3R3G7_9ACTN|nr:CBS domain-containing protein [Sphaerimonospora thailandensis]GIH68501.1 CBS domain-containing protein YhcV [Sphaerimonospora thailandensis]